MRAGSQIWIRARFITGLAIRDSPLDRTRGTWPTLTAELCALWLRTPFQDIMRPTIETFVLPLAAQHTARHHIHFSSATGEWATPQLLFDELDHIFGGFTLDPCATAENAKCRQFFTRQDDGLSQPWTGKVFMNPPYGREIARWVKKAWEESQAGTLVVCLLPARVDTRWWHEYARKGHVYFLKGRLRFGSARSGAPFPSAIVTFGKFFSR